MNNYKPIFATLCMCDTLHIAIGTLKKESQ